MAEHRGEDNMHLWKKLSRSTNMNYQPPDILFCEKKIKTYLSRNTQLYLQKSETVKELVTQ